MLYILFGGVKFTRFTSHFFGRIHESCVAAVTIVVMWAVTKRAGEIGWFLEGIKEYPVYIGFM